MRDELADILRNDVTPPHLDAIRLLRAYLITDHARAAEIIKSLDEAASDQVCSDLVGIYVPMARFAKREGLGFPTEEIHETFPRVVSRMSGDQFALTSEQVYEVCAAWFSDRHEQVVEMTRGEPTRELWLHAAASFTMTVGVKALGPQGFGGYLTILRKLRNPEADARPR
ncbi:hypothetical protein [Kutzneria albida]|uniref:Uncharacterized protein n=1 Tax=Kutzneria albida DSM 43870 TaxID=1449976 RepID=W5WDK7_9PSEU|nr:hypothetical protein [Kutzneria albida]AHH98621.1 hypothetical protein KALB_5259 [Kutzneria albida DSM 43870]